jgi:hypothetical protein
MLMRKRANSADAAQPTSNAGGKQLSYTLSPLLFEGAGGLLLKIPSGLTVQSVLRLTSHCSLRAHISVQEWLNAASAIGGITTEVAQHIFDVFAAVSAKSAEVRIQQSRAILSKVGDALTSHGSGISGGAAAAQAVASALLGRTVSLPGLMLYLIAQIGLERLTKGEGFTMEGASDNEAMIAFIKQHLHEVITAVSVTKPGRVSMSDLTELRILFREYLNGTESPIGSNLTFLWPRGEQTVDCSVVSQFMRGRIVAAAEVKAAAATYAVHQGLPSSVHILTSAPPPRSSSMLVLSSCSQSSIYVLAPLPSTLLSGLSNCLVVLGPVAGVLTVQRCERCQIVALCGAVVVSDCKDVDLFICTNSPPIYLGAAGDNVKFGPYNTFYSTLEEHLTTAGINPRLNLFRIGLAASNILPPTGSDGNGFISIVVPATPNATNNVTTRTNPCPLPPEYAEELQSRTQRFNATSDLLHSTYKQLEDNNRRDLAESLRTKVHRSFTEWLISSGQAKGIVDLLNGGTSVQ